MTMRISPEAEQYADELFFNESRLIYEEAKAALRKHKFVSYEDTAQKDYSLQVEAAAKMGIARMQSYVTAYEHEGEQVEHEDVLEFILAAKRIIERQSNMIPTVSGGTITMVRNAWPPQYKEQMLTQFRDKAFVLMEAEMNGLILKSKEALLKKALRKKMSKRNDLFRWVFQECGGRQYSLVDLRGFRSSHSEWTDADLEIASDYLAGENLIEQQDDSGLLVWLTHKGVKAGSSQGDVEDSAQSSSIQHTQNIFHGPVGAVQQGNQNIANVAQKTGAEMSEVASLLAELRSHLTPDTKESGIDFIDGIEEELAKETPKESKIRLYLKGLGGIATETGKALVVELGKKLLSGEIHL